MHHFWHRCHLVCYSILLLTVGFALGTYVLFVERVEAPPAITVNQSYQSPMVPVVHVSEINNENIVGTVSTGARLLIGEHVVIPGQNGNFSVPAKDFLVRVIDVPVPDGAQFVASRRGKKYYPVDSSAGQRLVPENRLYFRSSEEAEEMGYERAQ